MKIKKLLTNPNTTITKVSKPLDQIHYRSEKSNRSKGGVGGGEEGFITFMGGLDSLASMAEENQREEEVVLGGAMGHSASLRG